MTIVDKPPSVQRPLSLRRFEILECVGEGGMGVVYRARDPQLEREVAIKVLNIADHRARDGLSTVHTPDLRVGEAPASALLDEARMMARLSHPNVLPVYEAGVDHDAVFVVMELVDGTNLRRWLATPRSLPDILTVFVQIARGLATAHAHGIVHRDLKPDNVLIGHDERVRVADFGLSRLVLPGPQFVRTNDAAGTPRYMAPELWGGAPAGQAADVYAFCTSMAEALGADPAGEPAAIIAALQARGVPAWVRATIAAGRLTAPQARPTIHQVLRALERPRRGQAALAFAVATAIVATGVATAFAVQRAPATPASACHSDPGLLVGRRDPAAWRTAVDELAASTGR
jgi:serine/threonine protein kinase